MSVQATEAFSSQKRASITSNHEISSLFPTFVRHFCPPGYGTGSTDLIDSGSNTDPDPDPKPCVTLGMADLA